MSENLKLWKLVEKTDPKHTKSGQKGQYKFTSIAPMSQFKKATEVFGVQGIGWGIKVGSEQFSERVVEETILLNFDAVMFFVMDGQRGEIPIHATEKLSYRTSGASGYIKTDDEARKKVVTNAKTKGLSELGFNADIFMGLFDDTDYFNQILLESNNSAQNAKESAAIAGIEEFKKEFNTYTNLLKESENMATLNMMTKQYKNKISRKCTELKINAEKYISTFETIYNETKLKLEKPND